MDISARFHAHDCAAALFTEFENPLSLLPDSAHLPQHRLHAPQTPSPSSCAALSGDVVQDLAGWRGERRVASMPAPTWMQASRNNIQREYCYLARYSRVGGWCQILIVSWYSTHVREMDRRCKFRLVDALVSRPGLLYDTILLPDRLHTTT